MGLSSTARLLMIAGLLPACSIAAAACAGCPAGEVADRSGPRAETTTAIDAGSNRAIERAGSSPAIAEAQQSCRERIEAARRVPAAPGAPRFEERRIEILGRARGEPMTLLRDPAHTPDQELRPAALVSRRAFQTGRPGIRVGQLLKRHRGDPSTLRALVLREGYLYTDEPLDAYALVTQLELPDLFSEPEIWLQRAGDARLLRRETKRRETSYRYTDGPLAGRAADVLFGDRASVDRAALEAPLHRDLGSVQDELGFDRARVVHATEQAIVAELRFGDASGDAGAGWFTALLEPNAPSDPITMRLACLDADAARQAELDAWRQRGAAQRRALAEMRAAVGEQLSESLRFDRPEGEEGPDRDGTLRPIWLSAYLSGRSAFQFEDATYFVYDGGGRATPPQVCVDFVLDTFNRAAGTWYRPRGEAPGRVGGRVDFGTLGIANRRGVIAFGDYAQEHPELFEVRRFAGAERIAFRERTRFFEFLRDHADEVRPGDVVAIQGLKRDDRVHQHAILVERADPITGFPSGLADQMRRPRRRTWEGIMAEAPARSLFYRVRLRPELWARIAGADTVAASAP